MGYVREFLRQKSTRRRNYAIDSVQQPPRRHRHIGVVFRIKDPLIAPQLKQPALMMVIWLEEHCVYYYLNQGIQKSNRKLCSGEFVEELFYALHNYEQEKHDEAWRGTGT